MSRAWKFTKHLDGLQDGQRVAAVTWQVSPCPITLGHVQGFLESRRILMGEIGVKRPAQPETFDAVFGFLLLNG